MMVSRAERLFLCASWAVIGVAAVLLAAHALRLPPDEPARLLPDPAPDRPPPPAPPAEPAFEVVVTGRIVDVPDFPVDLGVLGATRLSLVSPTREEGEGVLPAADGSFRLSALAPLRGLRLRIETLLRSPHADRTLRRDLPVERPRADLGDVCLPRPEDLGAVRAEVVDAFGVPLVPYAVDLDPVLTPSGPQDDRPALPGNIPSLYLRAHRILILRVPPGLYRLRARAYGHRIPPVELAVGVRELGVVLAAVACPRRLLGSVRDARTGAPLTDVEVGVDLPSDPAWTQGRTSGAGLFDLPLPDRAPEGGLTATFARRGYRGTDVRLTAKDLAPGGMGRLHVELAPY
jgi:hypothetical protein